MSTKSKEWRLLLVVGVLLLSMFFLVGCDGADTDGVDTSDMTNDTAMTDTSDTTDGLESDLIGTEWTLIAMATDDEGIDLVPVADDINASITFDADGTYFAQAPVNTVRGPFTLGDEGDLTIADGAMTMMAGIDDAQNEAENMFVAQLARVSSYKVLADTLSLYDDAHHLILEFSR